jgi:hypothetical protein
MIAPRPAVQPAKAGNSPFDNAPLLNITKGDCRIEQDVVIAGHGEPGVGIIVEQCLPFYYATRWREFDREKHERNITQRGKSLEYCSGGLAECRRHSSSEARPFETKRFSRDRLSTRILDSRATLRPCVRCSHSQWRRRKIWAVRLRASGSEQRRVTGQEARG